MLKCPLAIHLINKLKLVFSCEIIIIFFFYYLDNFSDSSSRDSILKTSRLNTPSRGSVLRPSLFTTTTTATGFSNDNGTEPTDKSNVKPQVTPTLLEDSSSNPFLKDDSEQKSDQENKKNEENKDEKNDKDLVYCVVLKTGYL